MDQKTIAKAPSKTGRLEPIPKTLGEDFFQPRSRGIGLKNLNQAIHNTNLGMDLLDKADGACEKIEVLFNQIKQLATSLLASDLGPSRRSRLEEKISLKKRELDKFADSVQFKGKKILDGSLSASKNAEEHLCLMADITEFSENRINLNTGLNIPKISSKTMGLGAALLNSPEQGFKTLVALENALGIIARLKQRSQNLKVLLQETKQGLEISYSNHKAAKSALNSLSKAEEFLRVLN